MELSSEPGRPGCDADPGDVSRKLAWWAMGNSEDEEAAISPSRRERKALLLVQLGGDGRRCGAVANARGMGNRPARHHPARPPNRQGVASPCRASGSSSISAAAPNRVLMASPPSDRRRRP